MTFRERQILNQAANVVTRGDRKAWDSLKYQTQFGPQFSAFPYYPAALEMEGAARHAVSQLPADAKRELILEWKRVPRLVLCDSSEEILRRYQVVVLDMVVQRARSAGARTSTWS